MKNGHAGYLATGNRGALRYVLALLILVSVLTACGGRRVKWAAVKGDIRDLPAKAASLGKTKRGKIIVSLVPVQNSKSSVLETLRTRKADAGYVDARAALMALAKGEADFRIIAVTYRADGGKPERVLVVNGDMARKEPKIAGRLVESHRAAVRFLRENIPEAIPVVSEWTGLSDAACREVLSRAKWESSLDVAGLIDILDELRRSGAVSAYRAGEIASRLMKQNPPSAVRHY